VSRIFRRSAAAPVAAVLAGLGLATAAITTTRAEAQHRDGGGSSVASAGTGLRAAAPGGSAHVDKAGTQQTEQRGPTGTRTGAWATAMTRGGPSFSRQTVRMVVHSGVAGSGLRVRLSDLRSKDALAVGAADVAIEASGGAAVPGTHHDVTFSGSRVTTIAAGTDRFSDVIPMTLTAGENLLVSLYLPGPTGPSTWHREAYETTYLSTDGADHVTDDTADGFGRTTTSWYYLTGLDVVSPTARGTVVAFGDSITDGYHSTSGANLRWPDQLARRLAAEQGGQRLGVVDTGIAGNRVLSVARQKYRGLSGVRRFDHDVLDEPGVKDVIVLEGVNDLSNDVNATGGPLTALDLVNGYRVLINEAHAAGVRVIGGTILPYSKLSPAMNTVRTEVNTWIRTSGAFDAVVDFDKVTRDPSDPAALDPAYDSGDHLHPNDAGMLAMADAVDLGALAS
jgi:lysophospholipase L1-like esterase